MADGILGLAGGQASTLNQELIDKLKAAEKKTTVEPLEKALETWEKEEEKITEIETKVAELLTSVKNFDLFNLQGNAFEQKTASTTGNGVLFDAVDVAGLEIGTTTVEVTQLATKDVYQSSAINSIVKDATLEDEVLTIQIGSNAAIDFSTKGKNYTDLATEINDTEGLNASVEQVGDNSYRLVIKSTDTGLENALTISGTASQRLGFNIDVFNSNDVSEAIKNTPLGDETLSIKIGAAPAIDFSTNGKTYDALATEINATEGISASVEHDTASDTYKLVIKSTESGENNILTISGDASQTLGYTTDGNTLDTNNISMEKYSDNHIQSAKNFQGKIDGISYDSSSNEVTTQNGALKITAVETGTTSLNVQKDNSFVLSGITEIVEKYNELVDLMDGAIYDNDTPLNETSTLKTVLSQIKDKFLGTYGSDNDKNLFSHGITLDRYGKFSIDTEKLNDAVANNFEDLKAVFIGDAANKGLGTQLKEYLDELNYTGGLLRTYTDDMLERKESLTKEKDEATESLDDKYSAMTARFGEYSAIIARMDASFSGLKMMIEQSVASN